MGAAPDERRRSPTRPPGLAVIKHVSVTEAQPSDKVTYVIIYRNMGNTPIKNVTIADSLLPRLEYAKGTSRQEGTTFTSEMNRVGSTEPRGSFPACSPQAQSATSPSTRSSAKDEPENRPTPQAPTLTPRGPA